jgi:hypothetical protein
VQRKGAEKDGETVAALRGKDREQEGIDTSHKQVTESNQWLKINDWPLIHLTSESRVWVVKQLHFDDIFASVVSDQPLEQRIKKSIFSQLPKSLNKLNFFLALHSSSVRLK